MKSQLFGLSFFVLFSLFVFSAPAGKKAAKPTKGTVRSFDELKIVYDVRGQGDTALVFLHGWCGDRVWWKNQVNEFADDYRVVTIDQAGHGESGTDRKKWTISSLAKDVEAVVNKLGLKRVILIGHSMGGSVSLAAAKAMPKKVVAVVGVDTLHNAEFKWPEEQSKQFLAGFKKDFKGTMRLGLKGMLPKNVNPKLALWIVKRTQSQDPKMAIALMRNLSKQNLKKLLKNANVPVRCINSAPITLFAIPTATKINRKYADFDAVIMKGVGHFPMLERPDEFNQKLRMVLKEFKAKSK